MSDTIVHPVQPHFVDPTFRHAAGDFALIADALRHEVPGWCVVGAAAVNAHAVEPVYLQTLELSAPADRLDPLLSYLLEEGFTARLMPDGVLVHRAPEHDQPDGFCLQAEIFRREALPPEVGRRWLRRVYGLEVPCAGPVDAAQSKLWLMEHAHRRAWRRALDESDLLRLAERHPEVLKVLPLALRERAEAQRAYDLGVLIPDAQADLGDCAASAEG